MNADGAQGYSNAVSAMVLTCIMAVSNESEGGPTDTSIGGAQRVRTGGSVLARVGDNSTTGEALGVI